MNYQYIDSIKLACNYILHTVNLFKKITGRNVLIFQKNNFKFNENYPDETFFELHFDNFKDAKRMNNIYNKIFKPKNIVGVYENFAGPAFRITHCQTIIKIDCPLLVHNNKTLREMDNAYWH